MMRARPFLPLVALAMLAAALLSALMAMTAHGYASASNLDLWGRALLANSGELSIEKVVTAFPAMPYAAVIGLDGIFPWLGGIAPLLLSALLAAMLALAWFGALRQSGFSVLRSVLATVVLFANPLIFRAMAEGPGFMMLHLGYWMLALGMFQLRRGHRVNDIMLVSMGLVVIAFAHPFGLILVLGAPPFIALAVPPDRLRTAPASVFLVLLFPLAFALVSFCYVNWVFAGDGLNFLNGLSPQSAGLGAGSSTVTLMGDLAGDLEPVLLVALGIFAVCPIAISMFVLTSRLPPLRLAVTGLVGHLLCTTLLAAVFGLLPPLALVTSLGVTLAAATSARWPHERPDRPGVIILLVAGLAGSILVASVDPAPETARWRAAILGRSVPPAEPELAALAAQIGRDRDILFDAEAAPAVVALRGDARGIWSADTAPFQMSALRKVIDARLILVRDPHGMQGGDRVARNFPHLYEEGITGYRRVFDGANWRIYSAREEKAR